MYSQFQLTLSNAILRFVARKYNKALLGRTEKEEAMADMIAEEAMDLRCVTPYHILIILNYKRLCPSVSMVWYGMVYFVLMIHQIPRKRRNIHKNNN